MNQSVADEIWQAVQQAERVLLHCHPRSDADSVGSVLAFGHLLRALGKTVTIIQGDTPVAGYLAALPGAAEILPQAVGEIDLAAFDLFLILDSSSWERVTERGPVALPPGLDTVVIDHHKTATPFGRLNLIVPEAAATAEILFQLFVRWQLPLTREIAICLLAGLHGDTGHFIYANAQSQTFAAASDLVKLAPDFYLVLEEMENQNSYNRLAVQGLGLLAAKSYRQGAVWLATVSLPELAARRLSVEAGLSSFIAATLRSIKGCQLALALLEEAPGEVKVSARRRGSSAVDVSELVIRLGGGGHAAAAGATVRGATVAEVERRVLALIDELYPAL